MQADDNYDLIKALNERIEKLEQSIDDLEHNIDVWKGMQVKSFNQLEQKVDALNEELANYVSHVERLEPNPKQVVHRKKVKPNSK